MTNHEADQVAHGEDLAIVARAVEGDRAALTQLIDRHQQFVFNVALKMFGDRVDAEDLTQEVMIKVITSLHAFRGESAFRTWVYRIAVNHFIKTRQRDRERVVTGFASYFEAIEQTPDAPLRDLDPLIAGATIEELRLRCTSGMLMCLDREQRLTYILGAVFGLDQTLAAEVLNISPGNFRVRLHRARTDLSTWMDRKCGLVNPANPCRCAKKTRAYVRSGRIDPEHLVFNTAFVERVDAKVERGAAQAMSLVDELTTSVFRSHPYALTRSGVVDDVLGHPVLVDFFDL